MIRFVSLILILSFWCFILSAASQDSELVFSFMVHRHGDRTPSKHSVNYSTNPDELLRLMQPYGYGQLTEKGMRKAYSLGQYIRYQYQNLLGPKFNESVVYLRSTDVSRTKMTMLVVLAAVYPPVVRWKDDLNWTPVPYTTVPVEDDYNRPMVSCAQLNQKLKTIYSKKYPAMNKYDDVLALVTKETAVGFDVRDKPLYISPIYNVFESQVSLGLNLTAKLLEALPKIKEAADAAFDIVYHQNDVLKLFCGVLLKEFYTYANQVIHGKESAKVRIYSAHHENVYAFSKISRTDISGMPVFGSVFALNLKREKATNHFIVEPVFAYDTLHGVFAYERLQVDGCGDPCYYDNFVKLTMINTLDYDEWRKKCVLEAWK